MVVISLFYLHEKDASSIREKMEGQEEATFFVLQFRVWFDIIPFKMRL